MREVIETTGEALGDWETVPYEAPECCYCGECHEGTCTPTMYWRPVLIQLEDVL